MTDLYTSDDEIFALESKLSLLEGTPRLAVLVPLAWHLRQRNCERSKLLADEATILLTQASNDDVWFRRNMARIALIHAEINWLKGELEFAEHYTNEAKQTFLELKDKVGLGDSYFLHSSIKRDLGEISERDTCLQKALEYFQEVGEFERHLICLARCMHNSAMRDPQLTSQKIVEYFDSERSYPATVNAWLLSAKAIVANKIGDMGESCRLHILAHRAAFETGQIRQAILTATNAGDSFATLGDLDAALEWDEIALALARNNNWPGSLATALLQTGNALRLLHRYGDAREKLVESLAVQTKIAGSRTYAHTLCYLGDLAIDLGAPEDALGFFQSAADKIIEHNEPVFLSDCWRGQAIAYCRLGQAQEAHEKIRDALKIAQDHHNLDEQIKCYRVLAELAKRFHKDKAEQIAAPTLNLHYLLKAYDLCKTIKDITVPADLLDDIANSYADLDDFQNAFAYAKISAKAKESRRLVDAQNRAVALQVKHDNERHRAEAEHLRRIAKSEAERAASLQESSNTLETLGLIGREITANLNAEAVFESLHRHVNDLLDATSFGISLISGDGRSLHFVFGMENGELIPPFTTPIDHPISSFARCAREREEFVLEREPGTEGRFIIPGTMETLSLLYTPLMIGDRLLGVMSIQSTRPHVYGERERSILRTLAAYGAIALDNAYAYKQLQATLTTLRETQNQLEEVSITDPLTGMRNRRFLLQNIEADVARVLRFYEDQIQAGEGVSTGDEDIVFFMVDLDHFKSVNDTYGHACGDMVLIQMRDRLQHVFRESDYLIRWGGEEFLVVARSCNRRDAPTVAERIRHIISSTTFKLIDDIEISRTCSVGFASFPFLPTQPHLLTWAQVVNFADQGLYMVKKSGRNACIGISHTEAEQGEEFYNRVMRHPQNAADNGMIEIIQQKAQTLDDTITPS